MTSRRIPPEFTGRPGVNINCSGEQHRIEWDDEGHMIIDPSHDIELETSLIELGAETPRCIEFLEDWNTKSPLDVDVFHLALVGTQYRGWVLGQLAVDFADHVLWVYDVTDKGKRISEVPQLVREGIAAARQIPPFHITPSNEMLSSMALTIRRLNDASTLRSARHYANQAVSYAIQAINDASRNNMAWAAVNAAWGAGYTALWPTRFGHQDPWTDLEAPPAADAVADEYAWQRQRAIAVLKARQQGENFPRLF